MKIYKLSTWQIMKFDWKFAKTNFGRRAKLFSFAPTIVFLILFIKDIYGYDINSTNLALLFLGTCIAQLQYGNMLKSYIDSME